jgi:O-glycosyl hydrolase
VKSRFIILTQAVSLALCVFADVRAADVYIDPGVRFQTIEGWGTCMIGWSLSETPYNDSAWRDAYRDLGCNILRLPLIKEVLVADRQNPDYRVPVPLGANLQSNVALMDFQIAPLTTWGDFAAWLRANALEPDRVKIEGSLWSPPHWMKGPTGASQYHVLDANISHPTPWLSETTRGDSIGGRLKTEDPAILQMYGRYIAAWCKGFEQAYGVPLYTISLQNESTFENPFDSMTFAVNPNLQQDYGQYALGLKSVKDAWAEYGMTVKVMGPHVAAVGPTPDNPWSLLMQMSMIAGVKAHPDSGLIGFLSFYNSNFYMGWNEAAGQATAGYYHGKSQVPANWAAWTLAPGVKQDGKPIWFSETGGSQPAWLNGPGGTTPGNGAIILAVKMHNALVWSDASAYVYWQMSDTNANETEHTLLGRNHVANPLESKKYCAYKHFARYIRPGARRIKATFTDGRVSTGGTSDYDTNRGLSVSAFLHESDRRFTCVIINMRGAAEPITLHTAGLPVQSLAQYRTSSTDSFARLADVPVSMALANLTIPPYSVVTLTGETAPPDPDGDGDIDLADYAILAGCLAGPQRPLSGDVTGDHAVDLDDFAAWRDCLGGPDATLSLSCNMMDLNADGRVDLADFEQFQTIFTGTDGLLSPTCVPADFDGDLDVDLADYATLQTTFTFP